MKLAGIELTKTGKRHFVHWSMTELKITLNARNNNNYQSPKGALENNGSTRIY